MKQWTDRRIETKRLHFVPPTTIITGSMAFTIIYSPEAVDHLSVLPKAEQVKVVDQIETQLTHEPTLSTRKRKTLRPNALAPWQLRLGDVRVFYEVQQEPTPVVNIKAIGKKIHNELWIGEERIVL